MQCHEKHLMHKKNKIQFTVKEQGVHGTVKYYNFFA